MVQPSPFNAVARDLARRLINSEGTVQAESSAPADAVGAACDRLYRELSRWIGRDGCHALYTRALAQARSSHPLLEQIKLNPRSGHYVEGIAPVIMEYGDAAAASALEATMSSLMELLARLIGEDMAIKLIGQPSADLRSPDTGTPSTEEEA